MPLRLQMEDLQHIITDSSAQLANRRTFNFVVAVFAFLVISSAALLVGILAMASKPCTPSPTSSSGLEDSTGSRSDSPGADDRLCLTSGCLQAASGVLDSMDPTADPCDDFHRFACGGWISKHSVPPDQAYISVFDHLFAESERKLRETLESPVLRPSENSSERKMKEFFSMCVHDYGRMSDGGRALVREIREQLGGWFLLSPDSWAQGWSFQETLIKAHTDYGVPVLFNYYVSPDPKDRKRNIIGVQLPTADLGDEDVHNTQADKKRAIFKNYVRTLGTLMLRDSEVQLGDEKEKETIDIFVNDVYNQELALTQLRSRLSETERWEGQVTSLRELSANFTQVDWVTIFMKIFKDAGVTAETSIALTSLSYFEGLNELLKNESTIRDRMMNNYMVWTVVHTFADHLSWEYRQHKFSLLEKTTGRTEFPSTWHSCLSLMKTRMGFALAVELARTHMADTGRKEIFDDLVKESVWCRKVSRRAYRDQNRGRLGLAFKGGVTQPRHGYDKSRQVEKMVDYLKQSTQAAINNAHWMDAATKNLARDKVEYMETEIGFPPILSEESEVDGLYSKLKVNKSEGFFKNLIYASRFKRVLASIEYQTGYKYNLWEYAFFYNPLGVRPLYLWFYNTLIVPPSVFSYPLYTFDAPQAINFGALGSYLAARMVRSVDEVGRLVLNGTFHSWWSQYSLSAYEDIGACFLRSLVDTPLVGATYDNSSVVIDGHYQVIRVVAETAGLRLAYGAYKKWVRSHHEEASLPGLNMTADQLFFIAAAQARCTVRRDQSAYELALSGALPVDIMLNTMVTHVEQFAEAFQCPSSAAMVPEERCGVFIGDEDDK